MFQRFRISWISSSSHIALDHTHPLSDFGYAVNNDIEAIICVSCKKGVPADMVRSHCKIYHDKREAPSVAMQKEISQDPLSARLKTSSSPKYTQPPGQKPVDGLEVLQGYLCPLSDVHGVCCSKAFSANSTFVRHLSGHSVRPRPDPATCASPVQTLFAQGGLQMYFSVDVSLSMPDPPSSSVYIDVLPLFRSLPAPRIQVASNDKERASIHWFTRWPELLGPYCEDDERVRMLRSLVSFPDSGVDPDWLLKVKDHGCRWWAKAESAHVNCSYRASVLLKSHQECVSPVLSRSSPIDLFPRYSGPWKVLREDDSVRRYCGTAISLVSFCLRTVDLASDKVPTRFTNTQKNMLKDYRQYLETTGDPSDIDVDRFHYVLRSVLFRDKELQIDLLGKLACPVQSFLAILSIRSVGKYVKAGLVTQPISRLLYLSRGSVLLATIAEASGADDRRFIRYASTFLPLLLLKPISFCSILEEACSELLGTGEGKVSDELISLKKYASTLAMREPGYLNVLYDHDYTTLAYRGRNMSMANLQHGLNELVSKTWDRLLALSGGTRLPVDVPVGMSEDIRSNTLSHCFVNEIRDKLPTLSLLREMSKDPRFSLFRPSAPGLGRSFDVNPSSVCEFLHVVKPIVESIAFLLQVTGSGPLRMSEVVGDRYCNGSSPRNLFISHGRIFLLRTDLKSSTARGHRSSVVHFPPPKVADLLVYYLAVVRPLETFLAGHLGWVEEHAAYSQFIYVIKGLPLTPRGFSDIIATYSERYFGCRLTGLDLRHVLVNIQATFLPSQPDATVQQFGDSQAGHSTKTATRVYGQRLDALPGQEALAFSLSYDWCRRLHCVLGVGPDPPTPPIPHIHMPSEPTWWSPSQYIPQPTTSENVINDVHHHITTSILAATDKLSRSCRRDLREAVFECFALLPSNDAPRLPRPPIVEPQSSAQPELSEPKPASVSSKVRKAHKSHG